MSDKTKTPVAGTPATTAWANRTKAAAATIPLAKRATGDAAKGTRHTGALELFQPVAYKTGSFGYKVAYTVEGMDRKVYENIVLKTVDKNTGEFKATQYGEQTLKRRLAAFGLDSDAINNFAIAKVAGDAVDTYNGAPVVLILVDEDYLGKPQKRVKAVYPIEG